MPHAEDAADGRIAADDAEGSSDGRMAAADAGGSGDVEIATDASDESSALGAPDSAQEPTGPQVCGFSACAPGAPCPDLVVDLDDLRASIVIDQRTFLPTDCALVEGCLTQSGARKLLRFDTAAANIGTADLTIGDPTMDACFQYSDCHMHYHFKGVGQYTLYRTDGTTVAAVGHKQGFCLEDVEQYQLAPGPMPTTPYTCQDQGLHVGWEDVYPNDIDCQWVDITDVPSGSYILSVLINTQHYLPESNYENNEARVPVTIP
jgi:lysyl oxidase